MQNDLSCRQIHLDFHTSPRIGDTGCRFDADAFGDTLLRARVDSINLFAKCHHGMYYYPTRIGTMHPALSFDLLGAQVEACRQRGIRPCIYTCVAWNEDWADRHPEWLQVDRRGVLGAKAPFDTSYYSWRYLCLKNPDHKAYLKDEFRELNDRFHPPGYWIDIVLQKRCVCPVCMESMRALGLDPQNEQDVLQHDRMTEIEFMREMTEWIRSMDPDVGLYYNSHPYELDMAADPTLSSAAKRQFYSYIDIESIPSDIWGYVHFPVAANYLNHRDQPLTMMNGKFHLAWGDFGSLRNRKALEYECFRAIANGAGICVGDQLHPGGKLDPSAYDRIGDVFSCVEAKEPWVKGTAKVAHVGVFVTEAPLKVGGTTISPSVEGAYRILSEMHWPFDLVDFSTDLSRYDLVILPDEVLLDAATADRINRFMAAGGALLATGRSGLDAEGKRFLVEGMGVRYLGPSEYAPRYMAIDEREFPAIPSMTYVAYLGGTRVEALEGSQVLAACVDPYFQRTYDRFCSHRQTPPRLALSSDPAIVRHGQAIYISQPLFADYAQHGNQVYRLVLEDCIGRLVPNPLVRSGLPTTAELTLRRQGRDLIVHVLNYVIQRKSRTIDIIEESWPLRDVALSIRCPQVPTRAEVVPQRSEIPCRYADGRVHVAIPLVDGHQMVRIESAFPADA